MQYFTEPFPANALTECILHPHHYKCVHLLSTILRQFCLFALPLLLFTEAPPGKSSPVTAEWMHSNSSTAPAASDGRISINQYVDWLTDCRYRYFHMTRLTRLDYMVVVRFNCKDTWFAYTTNKAMTAFSILWKAVALLNKQCLHFRSRANREAQFKINVKLNFEFQWAFHFT